jgi:hypothetical protein
MIETIRQRLKQDGFEVSISKLCRCVDDHSKLTHL